VSRLHDKAEFSDDPEEEKRLREATAGLVRFWSFVNENPRAFTPTGAMATKVRQLTRRFKGPARPKSKPPRKRNLERKQGFQKRTRRAKRIEAMEFNRAMEQMRRDAEEMEVNAAIDEARAKQLIRETDSPELRELWGLFGLPPLPDPYEPVDALGETLASDEPGLD